MDQGPGWILASCFTDEARTQGPAKPSRYETPGQMGQGSQTGETVQGDKRSKTAYKAAWSEIVAEDFCLVTADTCLGKYAKFKNQCKYAIGEE